MAELHPIIRERRSGRAIDPDRPISEDTVRSLIEAARWAPSCSNNQPWRIVVSRGESLPAIKDCLSRGNAWAQDAPLIFTFASKPELGCRRTGRDYYTLDLGLAIENMLLQGISMDLLMHPIAGFQEQQVKDILNIPGEYRVHALVVAGHPLPPERMDELQKNKEAQRSDRKPVDEIAAWEGWFTASVENP